MRTRTHDGAKHAGALGASKEGRGKVHEHPTGGPKRRPPCVGRRRNKNRDEKPNRRPGSLQQAQPRTESGPGTTQRSRSGVTLRGERRGRRTRHAPRHAPPNPGPRGRRNMLKPPRPRHWTQVTQSVPWLLSQRGPRATRPRAHTDRARAAPDRPSAAETVATDAVRRVRPPVR